jgi:hypothetical protein
VVPKAEYDKGWTSWQLFKFGTETPKAWSSLSVENKEALRNLKQFVISWDGKIPGDDLRFESLPLEGPEVANTNAQEE